MNDKSTYNIITAIHDFRSARQKATLREIIAWFTGESTELLSFEEVRQKLKAQVGSKKVIKEIPISAIIGSVNRYQDFLRDFLPRENIEQERWANIELANYTMQGLPPIEAYQIDQVYFVSDGNHRVSVAKQLGATEIQAYVTEVHSRVPLTPEIRPESLILKAEYAEFLENTNIDRSRPEADFSVTVPGQYIVIEEHIAVHRYFMGIEQQKEISIPEAAADWYDRVFMPVETIIRERGLLYDFPNRTEADLYLWIADHRAALEEDLKGQVDVTSAADDLADQHSQRADRVIARIGSKVIETLVPDVFESGPETGEWRNSILSARRADRLFCEILVPINGNENGWCALEQAIIIARREEARLHGLYVLSTDADIDSPSTQTIQDEFARRCEAVGSRCELQFKIGDITHNICERARWNDLVVMNLAYPPEATPLARLSSGIRNLIQRCPRPLLFVPQITNSLNNVLLAYDGSPKAQEALFIAAYMAAQWKIPLSVITIGEDAVAAEKQDHARVYLNNLGVQANYIIDDNNVVELILHYAKQLNIDLLLMGGYSRNPVMEVALGGVVDKVLRESHKPMLICR
jgi:nucleotide-binding universal stress UspA family protein